MGAPPAGPVEIAAFDYDGTCIKGNSPVKLVEVLVRAGRLRKSVALRILLWGIAYKLRLPQNESWVRGLVFSAFEGQDREQVDSYLRQVYDDHLEKRFRPEIDRMICSLKEQGHEVWAVSATFEPIMLRAMQFHSFTHQFSTRMVVDEDGAYTRRVEGKPVEGSEKWVRLKRYADEVYGEGNWVLSHAFGDHHSDHDLLEHAVCPHAVCPDRPLARLARSRGWDIIDL